MPLSQEYLEQQRRENARTHSAFAAVILAPLAIGVLAAWAHPAPRHHKAPRPVDLQARVVAALGAYCPTVDYREDVCTVTLPEDFGDNRSK